MDLEDEHEPTVFARKKREMVARRKVADLEARLKQEEEDEYDDEDSEDSEDSEEEEPVEPKHKQKK